MTRPIKWRDALPEQRNQHLLMVYSEGIGWTTEPPKVKGLYFAGYRDQAVELVKVIHWIDGLYYVSFDDEEVQSLDGVYMWLGPLPVPEPPKGG